MKRRTRASSAAAASSGPSSSTTTTRSSSSSSSLPCAIAFFPDVVNACLSSFLVDRELQLLGYASPALLEAYGGNVKSLAVYWPRDGLRVGRALPGAAAFFALLARPKPLRELSVRSTKLLPSLCAVIGQGRCRHLHKLVGKGIHAGDNDFSSHQMMPLAALMSAGELPALKCISLNTGSVRWRAEGACLLLEALRAGACPLLERLGNFFPEPVRYRNEDGEQELMQAVAETVETRQRLGTCKSLAQFDGDWLKYGTIEIRRRVLRALLPSLQSMPLLESIPEADVELLDIGSVFQEVGAPCLEALDITVNDEEESALSIVASLGSMRSLQRLTLGRGAMNEDATDKLIELLHEHHQQGRVFLPQLQQLQLDDTFTNGNIDALRVFVAIGSTAAFANVANVNLWLDRDYELVPTLRAFFEATRQGAFSSLEVLHFTELGENGDDDDPERVVTVCQQLQTSPCNSKLKVLRFKRGDMSPEGAKALAVVIEKGGLPSLQILSINNDDDCIVGDGIVALAGAFESAGHSALKHLHLVRVGLNDNGLAAWSSAMRAGCLPNLKTLHLAGNPDLTDKGVISLSIAIATGLSPKLDYVDLRRASIKKLGAARLVKALLDHCQEVVAIHLPDIDDIRPAVEKIVEKLKGGRKRPYIDYHW